MAAVGLAVSGCGSSGPRPAGLRLERADLVYVARALQRMQAAVGGEVAAARAAWPALSGGLPTPVPTTLAAGIAAADRRAGDLRLPSLVAAEHGLTGPAAGVEGMMRSYVLLVQRGWRFLAAAGKTGTTTTGKAGATGFLRSNAPLYVYCVYDGHYDLSLVGRELAADYGKLGGGKEFGAALTPGEVGALGRAYSIAGIRLQPHPPASLKL